MRYNLYLEMKFTNKFADCKRYDYTIMKIVHQTKLIVIADYNQFPNKIAMQAVSKNRVKIIWSIISIILLLTMFSFIIYVLLYLISVAFEMNRYRIINTWLFPSLVSLLIVSYIINFVINLVRALFLFKLEGSGNKVVRFLAPKIITEECRYMYKIRNFLTKYYKKLHLD